MTSIEELSVATVLKKLKSSKAEVFEQGTNRVIFYHYNNCVVVTSTKDKKGGSISHKQAEETKALYLSRKVTMTTIINA